MTSRHLVHVDAKIEEVLAVPELWGGVEVLEPLVLALLQLRAQAMIEVTTDSNAQVLHRYREHLARAVGPGMLPLVQRLAQRGSAQRPQDVLHQFWQAEIARGSVAPIERTREQLSRPDVDVAVPHLLREVS